MRLHSVALYWLPRCQLLAGVAGAGAQDHQRRAAVGGGPLDVHPHPALVLKGEGVVAGVVAGVAAGVAAHAPLAVHLVAVRPGAHAREGQTARTERGAELGPRRRIAAVRP